MAHQYSRVDLYSSLGVNLSLYYHDYGGVVPRLLGKHSKQEGFLKRTGHAFKLKFDSKKHTHNVIFSLLFLCPLCLQIFSNQMSKNLGCRLHQPQIEGMSP